ncbi:transcriptional regulator GutM [Erwinia amylovora]|uniref:transcriptional regulator GutM n=1 Tax=Erwinia amylovora TaxID=552 RepID=UPI0002CAFA3F|nr:transcriptional regulator GutM [Erwinia amylovora]CCP08418.1 Sorbitol operon activator protein [Erwinia amylovora MR1]
MDATNTLILLAVTAWVGQILLGWFQIQNFNRALAALGQTGQVVIGRSGGRFKPRVVLALSLDEEQRVTDNFVMKGVTIFARPANKPKLNGLCLIEIQPQILFPKSAATQQALALAISHKG